MATPLKIIDKCREKAFATIEQLQRQGKTVDLDTVVRMSGLSHAWFDTQPDLKDWVKELSSKESTIGVDGLDQAEVNTQLEQRIEQLETALSKADSQALRHEKERRDWEDAIAKLQSDRDELLAQAKRGDEASSLQEIESIYQAMLSDAEAREEHLKRKLQQFEKALEQSYKDGDEERAKWLSENKKLELRVKELEQDLAEGYSLGDKAVKEWEAERAAKAQECNELRKEIKILNCRLESGSWAFDRLPPLPEFKESWSDDMKMKWFDMYDVLLSVVIEH